MAEQQGAITLTERERAVLDYLASHAGRYVPSDELASAVWGFASRTTPHVYVGRIRAKLGRIIEGTPFGYRLTESRAISLARRCPRCGRAVTDYREDGWVCHACGAMGQRMALESSNEVADLNVGRTPYAEGTRGGKQWTDEERQIVLAHMNSHTLDEIGEMVNRSGNAVRGELHSMGIRKPYSMGKRTKVKA